MKTVMLGEYPDLNVEGETEAMNPNYDTEGQPVVKTVNGEEENSKEIDRRYISKKRNHTLGYGPIFQGNGTKTVPCY